MVLAVEDQCVVQLRMFFASNYSKSGAPTKTNTNYYVPDYWVTVKVIVTIRLNCRVGSHRTIAL
jgi:hypothetical protein